jgi:hypothetical protein
MKRKSLTGGIARFVALREDKNSKDMHGNRSRPSLLSWGWLRPSWKSRSTMKQERTALLWTIFLAFRISGPAAALNLTT